ncbi:MAG: pseudouridine synthase [Candidatus Eisenbacteria bacterium]|nr:pseudouridine synthase [Candidatus Eisenbacteria bacterium]
MRLNRFLAAAGLGARRKCEELIAEGRIQVNGETAESPAIQVDPDRDKVLCDGERLRLPRDLLYTMMHKPAGYVVTAADERGRPTVYDLLPARLRGKVRAVGRLDQGSEGLLLFTNDGDLSNALLHPSHQVPRTYLAWVTPVPRLEAIAMLRQGVPIGPREKSGPAEVRVLGRKGTVGRVRITIREGKNREVRRMFRAVGARVLGLRRIRFDGVELGPLPPGKVRPLLAPEVESLRRASGLAPSGQD